MYILCQFEAGFCCIAIKIKYSLSFEAPNYVVILWKYGKDPIIPNDKCHNSDCICSHNSELSKYRYVPIIPIF
jgi:hypothetical protein